MSSDMPETISRAAVALFIDLARKETWVATQRPIAARIAARASIGLCRIPLIRSAQNRIRARSAALNLICGLPADIRIATMIDICEKNPDAIEDILYGTVPPGNEAMRYNLWTTLGSFARQALLHEAATPERIRHVGDVMDRQSDKKRRS